jgi:hypothetical protein
MALDVIELIVRVEKAFAIDLSYDEFEDMRTVGDLYRLVLTELGLRYQSAAEIESQPRAYPSVIPPSTTLASLWTAASVWHVLKNTIVNRFYLDKSRIRESTKLEGLDKG